MSFNVGDALALAKLSQQLYQQVWLVVRDANEIFRKLLLDLITIKNVLIRIDQHHRRIGQQYTDATQTALLACREALLTFRPLVIKYKRLASANGSQLRQKLRLPFDQGKIKDARKELRESIFTLNLAVSADAAYGSPDVPRRPEQHPRRQTVEDNSGVSMTNEITENGRLLDAPSRRHGSLEGLPWLDRAQTLDTINSGVLESSQNQAPRSSVAEESRLAPTVAGPIQANLQLSEDSSASNLSYRSRSSLSSGVGAHVLPDGRSSPQPQEHVLSRTYGFDMPRSLPVRLDLDDDQGRENEDLQDPESFVPIDTDFSIDIQEQLSKQPLYQQLAPKMHAEMTALQRKGTTLDVWLQTAIWWLVKARIIFGAMHSDNDIPERQRTEWPARVSQEQALVYFFKACYICNVIVFGPEHADKEVPSITWKLAKELASAIHDELHPGGLVNKLKTEVKTDKYHLGFVEKIHQHIEKEQQVPAALDSLEPASRWLTIHVDDAGGANEKVFLRTFVNAQIGDPKRRSKSTSAPYLLLLWAQLGRSEISISLANQSGTVSLLSTFTEQDIKRFEEHSKSKTEFEFSFPSQDCIIQFLSPEELHDFLERPRTFFKATRARESRPDEFLCFRDGLQAFDQRAHQLRASVDDSKTSQSFTSCEVSLYQNGLDQWWKAQRRLVISSSMDCDVPWCISYWLPIHHVRVQGHGRDVELQWSDCNQLHKVRDGNYGYNYSLIYNAAKPNTTLNLQFQSPESADEFKAVVLRPWNTPFETSNLKFRASFGAAGGPNDLPSSAPVGQELSVWQLMDASEAGQSMYLSIMHITLNAQQGFETTVYYVDRDVDFLIERDNHNSVSFEGLATSDYMSNIVNSKSPPEKEGVCDDVDWKPTSATFYFEIGDVERFMNTLFDFDLIFNCRALSLATSNSITASKQKDVIISLWRRPPGELTQREVYMTARWLGEPHGKKDCRWTTALIAGGATCSTNAKEPSKVVLKNPQIKQGSKLDYVRLTAVDARSKVDPKERKELYLSLPNEKAAKRMSRVVDEVVHPMLDDQSDVFCRPQSHATWTSNGTSHKSKASSNDAEKFFTGLGR